MINLHLNEPETITTTDNIFDVILASEELDDCIVEINEFNNALTNIYAIKDALEAGSISNESMESLFNISLDEISSLEAINADKRVSIGKKLLNKLSTYLREIGNNKGNVMRKVKETKAYVSSNREKIIKQSENLYLTGIEPDELKSAVKEVRSIAKNTNSNNVVSNIDKLLSVVNTACKTGRDRGHVLLHPAHTNDNMTLERAYHYVVDVYYSVYLESFHLMYDLQHMLQTMDDKLNAFDANKADSKDNFFHSIDTSYRAKLSEAITFAKRTISAVYICLMKWCKAILATK